VRIIGGKLKGRTIHPPKNLPARPTTDFAKTGLFNVLANRVDFEGLHVLDLFGGTGGITLEFASRGAKRIVFVEKDSRSTNFIRTESKSLGLNEISVVKSDVYAFLKTCAEKFDIIFCDPPYDTDDAMKIAGIIEEKKLLNEDGVLIVEHSKRQRLETLKGFTEKRDYGNVFFSFFKF
jgi:16S rRNA (guanine966-N2)-methyltransferase